ncbi:MAG: TOBE domain-containing protein, partial [Pseudomonadota bacterium]
AGLADGDYMLSIRPNHILPVASDKAHVALTGRVGVTELSGSESSAHFDFGGSGWVSLAHGTHVFEIGEAHTFYMDPSACIYFGPDGRRAA